MAVLEATGNIFRHVSIGKPDATSVLHQQGHNLEGE
jgi:hypothetical protein